MSLMRSLCKGQCICPKIQVVHHNSQCNANVVFPFLGDLKESPSLGESSHVMFSRMAKYSSLTAFYTFSEQQPKAIEDKVCLHQF